MLSVTVISLFGVDVDVFYIFSLGREMLGVIGVCEYRSFVVGRVLGN